MITIGFSSHRIEALPFARREMGRHQIIVLEEPPSPRFPAMLEGELSIGDYMLDLDPAFPEFERLMCQLLRELHSEGGRIVQVEPYLERLLQIHDLFAQGRTPEDVLDMPALKEVYLAEKAATGTLVHYYAQSVHAPFAQVIKAVKSFARADARRLSLRAKLRARAIASMRRADNQTYIEAGYIHYPLYLYLRQELGPQEKIKVIYLVHPLLKRLGARRRNMGPGDILTLRYALRSCLKSNMANLLAARSLIYIKLIKKEELLPVESDAPHSEDEIMVNRLVDQLGVEDCGNLFDQIRLERREEALKVVKRYLGS